MIRLDQVFPTRYAQTQQAMFQGVAGLVDS